MSEHEKPHERVVATTQNDQNTGRAPDARPDLTTEIRTPASAGNATPDPPDAAHPDAPAGSLSPEIEREIDDAMRAMEASDPAPASSAAPAPSAPSAIPAAPVARPRIRGPRVIEAGREHRHGLVVSVGPTDVFIEFGPKEIGVAPRAQWTDDDLPKAGATIDIIVDRFDTNESLFICSRPGAVQKADWELLKPGQIIECRVTGANKGGLQLEIAKHDAFMPASLIDTHHIEDLSVFVGEKITCKVERIDRSGRGRIVLNRRAVVAEEQREQQKELREKLTVGQNITGKVRKIMPFGAFVDLGGVDGLVHVSDLSHSRINKVEDVVHEGDEITVQILKLDWEKHRISLGLKQTQPDPYSAAAEQFPPESITSGKVTRITQFGAFIELAPGVEGLAHISELDWRRVRRVEDVLQVGRNVKVKVLTFDPAKQRISLSVKQTTKAPRGAEGESARSEEEIRKETPTTRRMREEFKRRQKQEQDGKLRGGGFGEGLSLGDLKL